MSYASSPGRCSRVVQRLTWMRPKDGSASRACRMVDLPDPLGPSITKSFPRLATMLTPSKGMTLGVK